MAIYDAQIRALMAADLPFGRLDPARHWPELFLSDDRCPPSLSWVELSRFSRYLIESRDAILPRQDTLLSQYAFSVDGAVLERDGQGREIASAPLRLKDSFTLVPAGRTHNPAVMYKRQDISVLPAHFTRLGYVVIVQAGLALGPQAAQGAPGRVRSDSKGGSVVASMAGWGASTRWKPHRT